MENQVIDRDRGPVADIEDPKIAGTRIIRGLYDRTRRAAADGYILIDQNGIFGMHRILDGDEIADNRRIDSRLDGGKIASGSANGPGDLGKQGSGGHP